MLGSGSLDLVGKARSSGPQFCGAVLLGSPRPINYPYQDACAFFAGSALLEECNIALY